MKFAFLIMAEFFDNEKDFADIHNGIARIVGVPNIKVACEISKKLLYEGIDCIELCGAFGLYGAKKIIEATEHKIPVGYITHLPEQNDIFTKAFSK